MDPDEFAPNIQYPSFFAADLEDDKQSSFVKSAAASDTDLLDFDEEGWLRDALGDRGRHDMVIDAGEVSWQPPFQDDRPCPANETHDDIRQDQEMLLVDLDQQEAGLIAVLEPASDSRRHEDNQEQYMAASIEQPIEPLQSTIPEITRKRQSTSESVIDGKQPASLSLDLGLDIVSIHSRTPSPRPAETETRISSAVAVMIPECTLLTPRSFYEPFDPPAPLNHERVALNDFAIYSDSARYGVEMRPLHHLDTKSSASNLFFDGVLSSSVAAYYIRRVSIMALPVDNYGDLTKPTVRDGIWIQSQLNSRRQIYYRLGRPAKEYRRFFEPFLWVADLAKHFVDYLQEIGNRGEKVTISHFREDFINWLKRVHEDAPVFWQWLAQKPGVDFRTSVIANLGYLYKEATGVLDQKEVHFHAIWNEVFFLEQYKGPSKTLLTKGDNDLLTVVTPYIFACFVHLPFGDRLKVIPMSEKTNDLRNQLIQNRHLEMPAGRLHENSKNISSAAQDRIRNIKPGDTISTQRDTEDTGTEWQREESHGFNDVDRWFALVQRVYNVGSKGRYFDVTWYYRPVDTLCGIMKYPWNNELFLSDHCSCGEKTKIREDEVLGVHDVDFYGASATTSELFCRQTYLHEERKWVTLEASHLRCDHVRGGVQETESEFIVGDTYLIHLDRKTNRSEPCELINFEIVDKRRLLVLRRLLRRREVDPNARTARLNELVYSDTFTTVRDRPTNSAVMGRCHVRFFTVGEDIPTPYNRDGVGAYFYITHRQFNDGDGSGEEGGEEDRRQVESIPLDARPVSLRQGHDPSVKVPRLRGLDLFCGGGNFGRGLEDGGGIKMHWANDYNCKAIHTYMANVERPSTVSPFLGSIDVLQRLAIEGSFSESVPEVGKVDFISGGSPCPGFSNLTNDKTTPEQRKNQSLIAAFASFIDLYRPRYGLLENVTGIVHKRHNRDQDVFSQLICAVVGLGYQAQFFLLDASSCGSPQRRSRVFLSFAAPGCKLPQQLQQTHSHPAWTRTLTLGKLPNGEAMAERRMPAASPFPFVSAQAATADLPPILDSKPDICVPFPDHRVTIGQTKKVRLETYHIPTRPFGINFAQAWYGSHLDSPGSGAITASERASFFPPEPSLRTTKQSNAWGRQDPTRPIETIVTRQSSNDAKSGRQLHWREDRLLSLMEARRAQGFRDEDVLLGYPADQYRIVGNSVAREVAVAIGLSIREAWEETLRSRRFATAVLTATTISENVGVEMLNAAAIDDAETTPETASETIFSSATLFVDNSAPDTDTDDNLGRHAPLRSPSLQAVDSSRDTTSWSGNETVGGAGNGAGTNNSKRKSPPGLVVPDLASRKRHIGSLNRSSASSSMSPLRRSVVVIDDDDSDE